MKKLLTPTLIILAILGYFILTAYSDYTWHTKYLKQKEDNWIVHKTFSNAVSPLHVYSIVKPPVVRIGLFDKSSLFEVGERTYYVRQLWVDRDIGGGEVKEETFQFILDCKNLRTGWNVGGENVDEKNIQMDKIEWKDVSQDKEALVTYKEECGAIEKVLSSK